MSGHEHLYERNTLPHEAAGIEQEMYFVISSGGGVPLRRTTDPETRDVLLDTYRERGLPIEQGPQVSTYHFTHVSVESDSLVVATYAVDDDDPNDWGLLDRLVIEPPATAALSTH
jgi:hypothetical protein